MDFEDLDNIRDPPHLRMDDDERDIFFHRQMQMMHGMNNPRQARQFLEMMRGRGRDMRFFRNERRDSDEEEERIINEEEINLKDDNIYFEDLINFPKKIYPEIEEEDLNILSLSKYKEININKLKEDIFYYCSSTETLLKLIQNIDEEKSYEFYQDINSENFIYSQKQKNIILRNGKIKLKSLFKSPKLSDYNELLCVKMSDTPIGLDVQEKNLQIKNANLIINKIEEIMVNYKEENVLDKLKELEEIIQKNKIEMKYLGLTLFNSIENNLGTLLNLIIDEIEKKENNDNILKELGNIFKGINDNFKSVKLLFIFIKFLSSHQTILESIKIDENKFNLYISDNSLDFNKIYNERNLRNKIFIDFKLYIRDKDIIEKIKENFIEYFDYSTINCEDNIFIFLNYHNKNLDKENEEIEDNKEKIENQKKEIIRGNIMYYFKLNIIEKRFDDFGEIELIKKENLNEEKIIDVNISIKNEFIYIFYIVENKENEKIKYNLKCKIYNQSTINLIKESTIECKESYIPTKLFNDRKYIYCISTSNELFIIHKKYKLNSQKYAKYLIQKNQEGKINNIINLDSFQMYNYLSINNLFILENNKENKKYIAKFSKDNKDEYLLYITQLRNSEENKEDIKLSFNDNRFSITKLLKNNILFSITDKENNTFLENGIFLLPFNSNKVDEYFEVKNIYEFLLKQYSSFLNIYGNFDLLNDKKEHNLVYYPFSYCCNFKDYNIDFIIKQIIKNNDKEKWNIKFYYLVMLKQMICSLYNSRIFKEEKIKELLRHFNEFIKNNIKENPGKQFNIMLKEIIDIISYIRDNSVIEIKDIMEEKNINSTTKFLLIELLLTEHNIQKEHKLYELLINFEKDYLLELINKIKMNKNNNIEVPNYSLYKKIMKKASEILFIYSLCEENYNKLLPLIPILSKNIQEIYTNFQINNNTLNNFSFIYNSFNFRLFYFIIQKIISNEQFINQDIITELNNTLLFLDENNINENYYNYLDMNNLIEIKNSSLRSINQNIEIPIEINNPKNIIIKTSFTSNKNISDLIQLILTKKDNEKIKMDLKIDDNNIFYEIKKIQINFLNKNDDMKRDFVINIIPIKDEKKYLLYKKNEDNKFICLIQKSLIYCLLYSLNNIQNKIKNYSEDNLIKNHSTLYQNELLKNINILALKIDNNNNSQIILKSTQLINEINKKIGFDINDKKLNLLKVEQEEKKDNLDVAKNDQLSLSSINIEIDVNKDINKDDNLFKFFDNVISKKRNLMINQIKIDENLNISELIKKIFNIAVKFCNYSEKLETLKKEINHINIEDNNNIIKIESLDNYQLFYSLYESSYNIKKLYDNEKNGFNFSKIEEESKKFVDKNLEKLNFIYDIIIPNENEENMKNKTIIEDILNLLKSLKDIEIDEIKIYSNVQNIFCQIIENDLKLFNNLLNKLKREENLVFLLNLMNKKYRQSHNIRKPFFDNIYGANYLMIDELKKEFHEILKNIFIKKKEKEKNKYSITTQISLLDSLMWKIKEKDFDLLSEIITIFKDLIQKDEISNINKIFFLEHKEIYNIKYFNEETKNERKKVIFELLFSQIVNILKIQKSPKLLKIILSYFIDIKPENAYYHDFILFFYKNIINSKDLLTEILSSHHDVIKKIKNIALLDKESKDKKYIFTKLIMIKLLCKILKDINKEKIQDLSEILELKDKNPFINLYQTINDKLNDNYIYKENIIIKYYKELQLICLNKLYSLGENVLINELINDEKNPIISLFKNNYTNISENNFMIKTEYNQQFENYALFYSENEKLIKSGKIICYLNKENNKSINKYLSDNSTLYFDKNIFDFYTENKNDFYEKDKNNDVFIIMDDTLESSFFKITSTEIKSFSDIIVSDGNKLHKSLTKEIINIIIDEIKKESLNDKGIYFILKIISQNINNLNEEEIRNILDYIYKYYISNKETENKFKFLSLEFLEDKINQIINSSNNRDIYKEKENEENNKNLSHLFNFFIKNKDLGLCLKTRNKIKWYHDILECPIHANYKDLDKINEIYKNNIKFKNLSFYKCNELFDIQEFNDDSILFTKTIKELEELDNLKKILNENKQKIKCIIINELLVEESEIDKFIIENNIPIYSLKQNVYNKYIDFFVKGIGGNYIDIINNTAEIENSSSIVDIYKLNIFLEDIQKDAPKNIHEDIHKDISDEENEEDENINFKKGLIMDEDGKIKNSEDNNNFEDNNNDFEDNKKNIESMLKLYEKSRIKKYIELIYDIQSFYCLANLKIIKRLIYEIICIDKYSIEKFENIINIKGILENLCMEYYFNVRYNLPNNNLKEKIKYNLKKVSNEWTKIYFDKNIESIQDNISSVNNDLSIFDLNNSYDFDILILQISKLFCNIIYDKLLFVLKEGINSNNKKYFINNYFDIINKIIENIVKQKVGKQQRYYNESDSDNDDEDDSKEEYEYKYSMKVLKNRNKKKKPKKQYFVEIFVYNAMKILYDYLINNYNKENVNIFKNYFLSNNFHNTMKILIEEYINMKDYFNEKEEKTISKKETLLIQISFKYLDFCLILFFRENFDFLEYWLKNVNILFTFYCNYKLLSTEKYYEKNDFKEIFSLIAYISDSINCFEKVKNDNNKDDKKIVEMKFGEFNEYITDIKEDDFLTTFDIEDLNNNPKEFNKLAIFCLDKNNNNEQEPKYILQDIIDINELKRKKYSYILKLDKKIYLVPLKNIKTYLYAFGYNYNHSLGVNGYLSKFYDSPTKCSGLPKYSWNISYGQNYCLSLDEETRKIYACGCGKGGGLKSTPCKEFTLNEKINYGDYAQEDKIVDFATGNCNTSVILNEKGEIFAIGENEDNFLKIPKVVEEENLNKLKFAKKLNLNPEIKVISMSISNKNCYIIDNFGNLYGIGDNSRSQILEDPDEEINNWTKIALPEGCRRFLQCANGERYLICLVEDDKGKGKLYSRGINKNNECGIKSTEENYLTNFVQCDETQNLNFKSIYTRNNRSAAITKSGKLYIWGQKCGLNNNNGKNNNNSDDEKEKEENIKCPTLVEFDKKNQNAIIDQVAISNTHIIAIGRILENGNYIKKIFSCGNNKKGALGIKINSFNNMNITEKLSEIEIINEDDKNSKLIPIKVSIGNHRSFVLCVDENELIQEIKKIKEMNDKANENTSSFSIKINHYIEENIIRKIKEFYSSENLYKFINLFRSLTKQCYSSFVDAIEEMKTEHNISTVYIYYEEFLNYLSRQNQIHDLFMIFGLHDKQTINESESIYNYLKTRIIIIENNIFKYCWTNMRSKYKKFLQTIIGNNISYITNEIKINKFNDLLSKIPRKNGEIKRINIDRFKAKAKSFYNKYNESYKKITDFDLDETIFGQVFHSMEEVDSKDYFLKKDKRLFIVCLQGEHASDQGGPYHEVISNICDELQSDYIGLLIKTPNNKNDVGDLSDKYILNPNSNRKIHFQAYEFLGKLMASSISTGEALDLNLHPSIWKSLLGNDITFYDYESIDYYFYNNINKLENMLMRKEKEMKVLDDKIDKELNDKDNKELKEKLIKEINDKYNKELDNYDLYFIITNSNDIDIELKPNGNNIKVNADNLKEFIQISKEERINEFKNQIEFLKKGFNSVISNDILQVLNWKELEEMVCGKNVLDIKDFKEHTEYEGFEDNDQNLKWFWEWFEGTNEKERIMYLKFVSGRSRLPKSNLGFKYRHIICNAFREKENGFPKATTCFFRLNLPKYDTKEFFLEKMKYAIINCTEIDTDQ